MKLLSCQFECLFCPTLPDFRPLSAELLTFTARSFTQCRRIEIVDDEGVEDNETFTVVLTTDSPIAQIIPGASSSAVTILDNDSTLTLWNFHLLVNSIYVAISDADYVCRCMALCIVTDSETNIVYLIRHIQWQHSGLYCTSPPRPMPVFSVSIIWLHNFYKSMVFQHAHAFSAVIIGLGQAIYPVTEGESVVQVCTNISGNLQRSLPVVVTLSTEEGTAQGGIIYILL